MAKPGAASLTQRIKAEFDARAQRAEQAEQTRHKEADEREQRLAQFARVCDDLRAVWRPRLEEFAKQFGEHIKVTPSVTPSQREAKMEFLTDLAGITLRLTASANSDVTGLVLDYDLLIVPMYFEYERHARLEMPLDRINHDAIGAWIDDCLISCVKAYLSVQDNELYLRRAMVEDPITHARFLRADAAATLEHKGQTRYFASEENLRQYKEMHQIAT